MNKKEFHMLKNGVSRIVDVSNLKSLGNMEDRTLIYGYSCSRRTFHVYLRGGVIHVVTYKVHYEQGDVEGRPYDMREIEVSSNKSYIPDKRIYPERCDYAFCLLLMQHGVNLDFVFTSWSDDVEVKPFYGFTLDDMEKGGIQHEE